MSRKNVRLNVEVNPQADDELTELVEKAAGTTPKSGSGASEYSTFQFWYSTFAQAEEAALRIKNIRSRHYLIYTHISRNST